ncbi:MAG TPA: YihY/virulence factor BrkB family protein [Steroidobacteraceae bacterium]|nr:YihY/virulence factor BrkB family protein [Steroidobacteraceae bacterium]
MTDPSATRGRTADRPDEIPARGWWDISWRVIKRLGSDNVSLVSGGLAMYALLSVFPALATLVFVYGLFATPGEVLQQMRAFSGVLPPGTWTLFETQLQSIVTHDQRTLTIAAGTSGLVSLWSARSGMSALMTATNIAYGEREKRSFLVQVLVSLGFTLLAVGGFLSLLALGVVVPLALEALGTSAWVKVAADVLRFGLLWLMTLLGLAFIYRYAPARERARWRWVTWGSAIAATLWLAASALFAVYVSTFGSYGRTYGALGGVIVLLMWFYISSFIVVLGAEINAEMERQTVQDTTVRGAPLGRRGAYAADTVGPSAGEADSPGDKRGIAEPGHGRG